MHQLTFLETLAESWEDHSDLIYFMDEVNLNIAIEGRVIPTVILHFAKHALRPGESEVHELCHDVES